MAGGEPRLGTTATYMRYYDHVATRLSTEIDRLHDRHDNEYRVFSAGSVRKWSKFGLGDDPPARRRRRHRNEARQPQLAGNRDHRVPQERAHARKGRSDRKSRLDAHDTALQSPVRRAQPR